MKPTATTPHPAKGRTKARVMYRHAHSDGLSAKRIYAGMIPCSVIPHATQRQALAAVRWANLDDDAKVERMAKKLFEHKWPKEKWVSWFSGDRARVCREEMRAVLQLLAGNGTGGAR